MSGIVIAVLFIALGLAVHVAVEHRASEAGRAALWAGMFALALLLVGAWPAG